MPKKKVEEIKTESAKQTIINQHKMFGKTIGINSCFGSSNVGQKAGFIQRELVRAIPNAFMRCPMGLYPEIEGPSQVIYHDDIQVTIDGCGARCTKKTMEKAGIKVDLSYVLEEDFALDKKPGPDFDEEKMLELADHIERDIREKLKEHIAE